MREGRREEEVEEGGGNGAAECTAEFGYIHTIGCAYDRVSLSKDFRK